jgi:hypothetical protein
MGTFAERIHPHVVKELERAAAAERQGEPNLAFHHLERAHVLGQAATWEHVRTHWAMLLWGVRRRQLREVAGQVLRIVGAATKTAFGLVPTGNTGGSNVSPFRRLPIPLELQSIIDEARTQ